MRAAAEVLADGATVGVDGLLEALDAARAGLLRRLFRLRPLRPLFANPQLRIPLASLLSLGLACGLALTVPLVSLWLGAALLGVPHVVAGLRHVAVRRQRSPITLICAAGGILLGTAQLMGAGPASYSGFALLTALAAASELARARPGWRRALPLGLLIVGYAVGGCLAPLGFLLVASHLHGLGAVLYFAARARQRQVAAWPLLVGLGLLTLAAGCGLLDPLLPARLWAPRSAAASITLEAAGTAGRFVGGIGLRRALFLYALGQSLHFAVWLRLMPELDRPSKVPHSFRRAYAALRADFGRATPWALGLCLAATPLLLWGGGAARESYFALTYFHVGLEAAALVGLVASRDFFLCQSRSGWRILGQRTPT